MTQHEEALAQKISDLEDFLNNSEKYARTGTLGKTLGHPKVGVVLEKLSGNIGLFVGGAASWAALSAAFHFIPGLPGLQLNAMQVGAMIGLMFMGPATPIAASIASGVLNRYSSTNEMDGAQHHKVHKAIQLLKEQNHPKLTALANQASQLFREGNTILAFWERFAYKATTVGKKIRTVKQQENTSGLPSAVPVALTSKTVLVARTATGIGCDETVRPSEKSILHSKM